MRHLVVISLLACCALEAADRPIGSVADMPGVPEWKNAAIASTLEEGRLTIVSGPSTDWYISPVDGKSHSSAPLLLFRPAEDFVLTARLNVEFTTQWDAGMLVVYGDDRNWAKFALEMSVYREPTIVTVVTRGVSDDCNSFPVSGASWWYRIARMGRAFGFYASPDGRSWKLVRAFTLGDSQDVRVGFGSQSPVGQSGRATFSEISYSARTIKDIFQGE
jgi:regulation of enolase protein 1 (concanavalin A-like superfamily)